MADAFENILGQPKVREFLRASVVSERVTQAYLFVGPAGSNKTQAAYALAQALMCPKGPRGPWPQPNLRERGYWRQRRGPGANRESPAARA